MIRWSVRWPEARALARWLAALTLACCGPATAASCNLSVGSLNFGSFVGTQTSTSSSASFTCTNVNPALLPERVDFEIRLSTGAGTYAQRQMNRTATPADTLQYNLYLNFLPAVLNTNVWGDGSGTTVRWTGRMNLSPGQPSRTETATLVGAIPSGPAPSAGSYQDTVVVTVLIL
jgi:spore coat protein U-like protein